MIYYSDFLAGLKDGTVLIIDTCLALHEHFAGFLEALENTEEPQYKAVIPIDCYLETSKLSVTGKTEETRLKATAALSLIHRGLANNTLSLMKEYSTGNFFADPSIIGAALSLSTASDVIVMTQDCKLSRDIRAISKSEAVSGGVIDVYKLASRGGGVYCFTDLNQKDIFEHKTTAVQLFIEDGSISRIEYLRKEA